MSCDVRLIDFNYVNQSETVLIPSTENADYPVENIQSQIRSKVFRTSSASGTQSVVFDLKTIEEIDSVIVFPDPFSGFKYSTSAIFKIQASATNVWTAPPIDVTLTINEVNQVASHFFTSDVSYRYWRVSVTDPLNPYGYIEIGKVVLGKKLDIARTPEIGFSLEYVDQSNSFSTPFGHKYFDIYPNKKVLSINLNVMPEDDIYKWLGSFDRVGRVTPIVLCLDSTEQLFDKDTFLIYGTYINNINLTHIVKNYFKMPMTIEEMF